MRVLVAAVSSQTQYVRSLNSYYELKTRPGDEKLLSRGTRGDAARIELCAEFLKRREFDAILLLDLDMILPEDLLEKLREHDLDMVSGHYYKRDISPMVSIAMVSPDGTWPYVPLDPVPDSGLVEVITAGFGCVLIKRHVVEAVKRRLPPGGYPFAIGPMPEMTNGDYLSFGADFRFFTRARQAGFRLFVDTSVECLHGTVVWLGRKLYKRLRNPAKMADHMREFWKINLRVHGMNEKSLELRLKSLELEREALDAEFAEAKDAAKLQELTILLHKSDALLEELRAWKVPPPTPEQFPVVPDEDRQKVLANNRGIEGLGEEDLKQYRQEVYTKEALDYVEELNKRDCSGG